MENLLWLYRRKFGMDAYSFAKEIGITPQRLSRIERNQEEAADTVKDTASRVLGVPKETLFPSDDPEFRKLMAPVKDEILTEIEKSLSNIMFCERALTSLETNRWLFWADEILELITREKIPLDSKIKSWLLGKIEERIKQEEEKIEEKREKILDA